MICSAYIILNDQQYFSFSFLIQNVMYFLKGTKIGQFSDKFASLLRLLGKLASSVFMVHLGHETNVP